MDEPPAVNVLRCGALYTGTPRKVVDIVLDHAGWPGWQFTLDVALDGTVLALAIRPENEDAPPDGGIQTQKMLRKFPLEALVKATRRSMAELLDGLARGPMRFVEVDDAGTPTVAGTMTADAAMRSELSANTAAAAALTGLRRGPRRIGDAQLARECRDYLACVEAGESVAAFCTSAGIRTGHARQPSARGDAARFVQRVGQER